MKRNIGLDIIRAVALLLVLNYHFYVLAGNNIYSGIPLLHNFIEVGGELGVTLFFMLSGYGIYLSIDRQYEKGSFNYGHFLKKRCLRILPQYYLSLLIIILIGGQTAILSNSGIFDIFTHALLIHNFFPSTAGSISTVLWTQGVIFQFYLVSVLLYKLIKKHPKSGMLACICFTISTKVIIYHFVFSRISIVQSYYFVYGRQLFSSLDNFAIGMFIARLSDEFNMNIVMQKISFTIAILLSFIWCVMPQAYLRYSDTLMGYFWHSVLNVLLAIIVWDVSSRQYKENNPIIKVISFIAKYEYGTFLWHFVVASNLMAGSQWINSIRVRSFSILSIVLCFTCVIVGYVSTKTLDSIVSIENKKVTQI